MTDRLAGLRADGFGHWLAGFAAGEGCFGIRQAQGSYRCCFRIELHQDDRAILEEITARTHIGYVKTSTRGSAEWLVISKAECMALATMFDAFPIRNAKQADYAIWRSALMLWSQVHCVIDGRQLRQGGGTNRHPHQKSLAALKVRLSEVRRRSQYQAVSGNGQGA